MIRSAIEAMHNSYSPYSKFKVGAAALLKDGTIVVGTNIENASYGLSMCAERVCLFNVYSKGYRKNDIISMCIASKNLSTPCGACRQVMAELLNPNTVIILTDEQTNTKEYLVKDLLPDYFKMEV
ncbi:MAG: cytidine deaminase [bacterium]|nr:cytidine deaminase [bacterium]